MVQDPEKKMVSRSRIVQTFLLSFYFFSNFRFCCQSVHPRLQAALKILPIQLNVHKLKCKNYLEWAQLMKPVINGIRRLDYLTGGMKEPTKSDPK